MPIYWFFIVYCGMFLKKISVVNYKNISSEGFDFDENINCFIGDNGVGKTNLLDAVYHLGVGKSYFNPSALQNIRHGEDFYLIEGLFEADSRQEQISCSVKKGHKKIIKCNGKPYERMADHFGKFPMVVISPSDRDLIVEGSETRRKFMDSVISQSDLLYLDDLMRYNRVLSQRNSLLKHFANQQTFDALTLSLYDEQLSVLGSQIHQKRKTFIEQFLPTFLKQYAYISQGKEQVNLRYESQLNETPLIDLLQSNIHKDRLLQYTGVGIHKDDVLFEIDGYPIKKYGSQGQQKSFLIALKLAQFQDVKKHLGVSPVLLLDDIFDKLDDKRVTKLVGLVTDKQFGQLFITDTHQQRTQNVVEKTGLSYKMFLIDNDKNADL